jgi:apolipoprotein N-acyltransferase
VTLVLALGYGAFRMSSVESAMAKAESVEIGMVQGNRQLRNALKRPRKKQTNPLVLHMKHTRELAEQGADLVVWSEAASQARFNVDSYEKVARDRIGRHLGVPTIIGVVLYERLAQAGAKGRKARFFNSALMVDGEGNITGRYDKYFLLMFGEYLPLGDTFPILYEWSPNSGAFSKGTSRAPLEMGEHHISTMICYEDIVPGYVSELVAAGHPDLFVNMTNDAWFGATIEPFQHLALAKFRSVEHRRYMARVTNTGMTAMIDPIGRVTATGSFYLKDMKNAEGEAILAEAKFMNVGSVFSVIGEKPYWLLTALMLAAAFVRRKKSS